MCSYFCVIMYTQEERRHYFAGFSNKIGKLIALVVNRNCFKKCDKNEVVYKGFFNIFLIKTVDDSYKSDSYSFFHLVKNMVKSLFWIKTFTIF